MSQILWTEFMSNHLYYAWSVSPLKKFMLFFHFKCLTTWSAFSDDIFVSHSTAPNYTVTDMYPRKMHHHRHHHPKAGIHPSTWTIWENLIIRGFIISSRSSIITSNSIIKFGAVNLHNEFANAQISTFAAVFWNPFKLSPVTQHFIIYDEILKELCSTYYEGPKIPSRFNQLRIFLTHSLDLSWSMNA